jgi:hypothetical protein
MPEPRTLSAAIACRKSAHLQTNEQEQRRTASTHCPVLLSVFMSHCLTYGSKNALMSNSMWPLHSPGLGCGWMHKTKSTHWGQNAACIDTSVLTRRYSAKMSWMGTSGVGPFMDDSNSRFCEACTSRMSCGTCTSTTRETRSSCLRAGPRYKPKKEEGKGRNRTQATAPGTSYQAASPSSPAHPSSTTAAARD